MSSFKEHQSSLIVCIVVIIFAIVVCLILFKGASICRFRAGEGYVNADATTEKATYDAHSGVQVCKVLADNDHALSDQPGYVHASFVDTQRLRQWPGKDNTCYLQNDERHNAQDVFFAGGKSCSRDNPALNHPAILNIYETNEKAPGEVVPVKKCVIEFDEGQIAKNTGMLNGFWTAWGQVQCDQIVAPLRAVNRDMRTRLSQVDNVRSALLKDNDGLTKAVEACNTELSSCNATFETSTKELQDVSKHLRDCKDSQERLKTEYGEFRQKMEFTKLKAELDLKTCEDEKVRFERLHKSCDDTRNNIRRDNATLKSSVDALKQGVMQCNEDLDTCNTTLSEVRGNNKELNVQLKRARQQVDACTLDLNKATAAYETHIARVSIPCTRDYAFTTGQIKVLLRLLEECRNALRSERADNIDLTAKLAALQESIDKIQPENTRLAAENSECQRALMGLQQELAECLAKLKTDTTTLQETQATRVREVGRQMVAQAESTANNFCSKPEIVPDALTERDRATLVSDIDNCRELLAMALKERDEWKMRYNELNSRFRVLQEEYNIMEVDKTNWNNKYESKQECMTFHNLCDRCTTTTPAAIGADWGFAFVNAGAFISQIRTWFTNDMNVKTALFGGGEGRITTKTDSLELVAGNRDPRMQLFPGSIRVTKDGKLNYMMTSRMVDLMPSIPRMPRICIFVAWPAFKLKEPIKVQFKVQFDDDFYIWNGSVTIWAGSWHAVESTNRTVTIDYTFRPNITHKVRFMYANVFEEGYANVINGANGLLLALNMGKVWPAT